MMRLTLNILRFISVSAEEKSKFQVAAASIKLYLVPMTRRCYFYHLE